MHTDYDTIAERYRRAKLQPWRSAIECYTLMALAGDLVGRAVVDLACGEGHYTRLLRQGGGGPVVGVDLSDRMIELARAEESAHPLGIDYRVGDARSLDLSGSFDLAVAAYLLNYASSPAELGAMCEGVARCLRPGGRFIAANTNPALDFDRLPTFLPYGFEVHAEGEVTEGSPITWTLHLDDGPLQVVNFHLGIPAHEEALRAAGFSSIRWHGPRLSPQGEAARGAAYWRPLLDSAPVVFIECSK